MMPALCPLCLPRAPRHPSPRGPRGLGSAPFAGAREAVLLSAFRAGLCPPARRIPAVHQLPDRAEVRVPELLLPAPHSGGLLRRASVRGVRGGVRGVARLLLPSV